HVEAKTSLFFLLEDGRRIALRRAEGQYLGKDRKYSTEELKAQAEHISPNALLRPVLQDYMIPTAAYVGGPAELAYFAQSAVIYETLLGYMPRLVSRSGFTLFDARTAKLMDRYHLHVKDLFHGETEFRERMAAHLVPPALAAEFAETMRRNERAAADAEYLYNALMPHKHLQERFYSILPFLAKNGPELIDRVYDHVK